MKNVRRIMAILLVVLLASNCFSSVHAASLANAFGNGLFAEEKESISIETSESDEAEENSEEDESAEEESSGKEEDSSNEEEESSSKEEESSSEEEESSSKEEDSSNEEEESSSEEEESSSEEEESSSEEEESSSEEEESSSEEEESSSEEEEPSEEASEDEIVATDNNQPQYNGTPLYRTGESIVLYAPKGYKIADVPNPLGEGEASISFAPTQKGEQVYYLIKSSNGDILTRKYKYIYEPIPKIEKIEFVDENPGNIYGDTVYTNKDVKLKITFKKSIVKYDGLGVSCDGGVEVPVTEYSESKDKGEVKYEYYAFFTVEDNLKNWNWSVGWNRYLENQGTIDKFHLGKKQYKLVIDTTNPSAYISMVGQQQGDYPDCIVGEFTVSDTCGIASVKYCWDKNEGGFLYDGATEKTTEYQELKAFGKAKNQITYTDERKSGSGISVLPYEHSSWVTGNIHKLYLEVEDYAGNKVYPEREDGEGYDPKDPLIEKIEIVPEGENALNVTKFGTFSNGAVTIKTKVSDDMSEDKISGIQEVSIADQTETESTTESEYSFTFDASFYNEHMKVIAYDKAGRDSEADFSSITGPDEETKYSNVLILEKAAPKFSVKFDGEEVPEEANKQTMEWFNGTHKGKKIQLTWQDRYDDYESNNDKSSGLQHVYFEYMGRTLTEETGVEELICEPLTKDGFVRTYSKEYTIGDQLASGGEYCISSLAVDNAGNEAREIGVYTFAVDLFAPTVELTDVAQSHKKGEAYYIPAGIPLTFNILGQDEYSGLANYTVWVNGTIKDSGDLISKNTTITIEDTSLKKEVKVKIVDVAGNEEWLTFTVLVDGEAPVISPIKVEALKDETEHLDSKGDENSEDLSEVFNTEHGIYHNNSVRILVNVNDKDSGISTVVLSYKSILEDEVTKDIVMQKMSEDSDIYYAEVELAETDVYLEGLIEIKATDMVLNSETEIIINKENKEVPLVLEEVVPLAELKIQKENSSEESVEEEITLNSSVKSMYEKDVTDEENGENEKQVWYSGFDELKILLSAEDRESGVNEINFFVERFGFNPGKTIVEKDLKDVPLYVEQPGNTIRQNQEFLYHFSAEYISTLINDAIDMPENPSEEEPEEPSEDDSEETTENSSEESSENSSEETTENSSEEPTEGYMNTAYHANEVTNNAGKKQESELLAPISEGEYRLHYQVKDNAGNVTELTKTYFIDSFAPEIVSVSFTPADVYGKEKVGEDDMMDGPIEQPTETEYGYFFKKDFILTIAVSDGVVENHASAGLGDLMYRIVGAPKEYGGKGENTEWITATRGDSIDEYTLYTIKIEEGFKGYIYFEVKDLVGNTSGEKTMKGCVSDDDAPGISGRIEGGSTPYKDEAGNPLYTRKVTTSFSVDDLVAGVQNVTSIENSEKKGKVTDGPVTSFEEHGWKKGLENGGLVLGVSKQFTYETDDNNISVKVNARDNSNNDASEFTLKTFSIDMTKPVVNIQFREDDDSDLYYSADRIADIRIKERNFDANRMNAIITNTFGAVPSVGYTKLSKDEYVATITFGEGDYTFDYNGTDRANHAAQVNFAGGNEKKFYVDKTNPVITTNFDSFANVATDNNFNVDKVASIRIEEHNFSPELVHLVVLKKEAGALHNADGFTNVTSTVLKDKVWTSNGDVHTMEFTLSDEAVYQIQISMTDLAGNAAETQVSPIFEIDKTAPTIVSRNGVAVGADDVENVEVYPYTRAADPIPYVEFEDLNYAHMRYRLVTYIPAEDEVGVVKMDPLEMYAKSDEDKEGIISDKKFTLPEFSQDGVYSLEIIAVDDAGNESLLNQNTYMRIVKKDVLAYIMDSDIEAGTGLYSFQYENGEPISKRPDNFMDLRVCVLTKLESPAEVVLRDTNGREYPTNAKVDMVNSIYGVQEYYFNVDSGFFKETFQDDTDIELFFTVKNEENRIDLGKMHIDNIIPECEMPKGFKPWHWYYGKEARTITLTNINELLDVDACKVFDNGREIEFSYYPEKRALEFTIDKGWHNVGLILTDVAGNSYNIQELRNIHVGFFWLWMIIASAVVTLAITATGIVLFVRKRAHDAF
ncbi:MAG: hypothetical protein E7288_09240 [Lachnospiraceae bacterium]|nr:hypothetical protein [Lachnospiraceae bacterium]